MDSKEVPEINVDSETTVEIKIRTLDSQTYTIRVDKCVPIPALKEQIAVVTGILSEQQRLICRGKVLKDDQLLSAYHVEDGHTLHLVVREPHTGPSASQTGTDSASGFYASGPTTSTSENQRTNFGSSVTRTFVFEASNAGQSDIDASDISRILTSVLDSIGSTSSGDGNLENDIREMISEGLASQPNRTNSQTNRRHTASSGPDLTVIPDSITTMSQYIGFMRGQFEADGFHANVNERSQEPRMPTQVGLPTPAALADVIHSSRQLLVEQTGESLLQIAGQLEDQTNLSDSQSRTDLQRRAIRFGALMQNLGSLLLELGRTTMTLHMGQNPAEAIVNAGPATFISASRPNPLMVQAVPFNPSSTTASSEQVESGFPSRSLEIRIRRSRASAPATNEGEQGTTDASTTNPQEQTHQASNTSGPNIDSRVSRGSIRVVYPVLAARTRNFNFGNHANTDGRAATVDLQTFLDNAVLAENVSGSRSTVVSGIPQASVNQQTQPESINTRQTEANDATRTAESHNPASVESNEQGIFFSNILREIIPRISQVARQGVSSNQPSTSSTEVERMNLNGSSSSSQHEREAADAPSPKRTKREDSE